MNRRRIVSTVVMTALGLVLAAGHASAQLAKEIAGTWTLVSAEAFGSAPKGSFILDANGRFASILTRNTLPKYASNSRVKGTSDEYKATVEGSLAYFGTYSVSGSDLIMRVESSTYPNWIGTEQKRINVSITGDELKYTQPAPSGGGPATPVVWKRVK